ncbi:hypothetical protein [Clostridium massiliamazoniense]|uniref:hypothetical protein n=1 Tax=Clostridium massiliamazoniense TaxID=1347366 RepID=UPI0006D7907E|nr:hypothetical protein [Clostridium massiliamazoniense]
MNKEILKSQKVLTIVQFFLLLFVFLVNKNGLHNVFIKGILLFIVLPITLYNLINTSKSFVNTIKKVARK